MAKKYAAIPTSEPALFSTEAYSSGLGDIERQSQDPYWDEIILDSEITQVDNLRGVAIDDKGFKVGDRLLSSHPSRRGEITINQYPSCGANNEPDFNFICTSDSQLIHVKYLSRQDSSEFLGENKQ